MVYNQDHRTPLFGAVKGDHVEVVEYLLDNGADPDIGDRAGETSMMRAVIRNVSTFSFLTMLTPPWRKGEKMSWISLSPMV